MQQDYDNGKYTVIFNERTGAMHALRHGEAWQDMSGNNLVYWMLVEHKRALERIADLEKDAERYRWLRAQHNSDKSPIFVEKYDIGCGSMSLGYPEFDNDLDGAIDTAMKKD